MCSTSRLRAHPQGDLEWTFDPALPVPPPPLDLPPVFLANDPFPGQPSITPPSHISSGTFSKPFSGVAILVKGESTLYDALGFTLFSRAHRPPPPASAMSLKGVFLSTPGMRSCHVLGFQACTVSCRDLAPGARLDLGLIISYARNLASSSGPVLGTLPFRLRDSNDPVIPANLHSRCRGFDFFCVACFNSCSVSAPVVWLTRARISRSDRFA